MSPQSKNAPIDPEALGHRSTTGWRCTDEQALIDGVLARDGAAWRELERRYRSTIDARIRFMLGQFWSAFQVSDAFEDVKADFHVALLEHDMKRLRLYDSRGGSFKRWLWLIAGQVALKHIMKMSGEPIPECLEDCERHENQVRQRGAKWIGEDRPSDGLYFDELRGERISTREQRRRRSLRARGVIE